MLELDLKSLIALLNPYCSQSLHEAAGVCISRKHYEVTPEHHLLELLGDPASDIPLILGHLDIDDRPLRAALRKQLESLRAGNPSKPVFSPLTVEWFQDAWMLGSVDFGARRLRSAFLLMALLHRPQRFVVGGVWRALSGLSRDAVRSALPGLLPLSAEAAAEPDAPEPAEATPVAVARGSSLERFTVDLTAAAREGRIDPVFGRTDEVRQIIDILARRRRNNPILVGEPGVGKTAVVEGLALRIAQGQVPSHVADVVLLSLDLGALQAGAGVRGEFENRVKAVINEVKASPVPIVLFIDEAHTIIGAGGAQGGGDAANLLKPALARGELRTIAATTWAEYQKYFRKDAALARRFEVVRIPEPSPEQAVNMLRGLAERYAQTHSVHIRDDAVEAAVRLSDRYITGRLLPDKAVGLLDTCAARVRIAQSATPSQLDGLRARLAELERERSAHVRDLEGRVPGTADRRPDIDDRLGALRTEVAGLEARWQEERALVERVVSLRGRLLKPDADDTDENEVTEDRAALEAALDDALEALAAVQGEAPMVFADVGPDTVAQVISDWTGIPVGRMVRDEAEAALRFEAELGARIKGQDHALRVIGERIRQAKSGLQDPDQPLGVFLLVGPSGVGKTETALGLASLLYGGERSVITFNLSEFQDKTSVNRLIGSPPGYVGHEDGGELTEAVRRRPYSVVLLDECEKACLDVMNLFYQVFDKGTLTDGKGQEVNLRNTIILLTSNLATERITRVLETGPPEDHDTLVEQIRPALSRHFKPALLARMTVVPYYPLTPETLRAITDLKLGKVARRLQEVHGITLAWSPAVADAIAARCTEVETGARNVDHIIRGTLMPLLSRELLSHMGEEALPEGLAITVGEGGGFRVTSGSEPERLRVEAPDDGASRVGPSPAAMA
ncbi:MAG: type VI secretion system ATPase TssH [Alphaproteobacteria bacterium]|nr:type VI secretion system ATPase TssH [Alphaproteobacteria bacterium]